jgi:hypothetical protein
VPSAVVDETLETVGAVESYVIENCVAAVLPLPAVSLAPPVGTSTVTLPSSDGVIVAVYDAPLPLKLATEPFPTVRSPDVNPVTDSLNVIVIGIGDVFVGLLAELETVTVGAVVSMTMFLFAPSDPAAPGATSVKVALLPATSRIVPPFVDNDVVDW